MFFLQHKGIMKTIHYTESINYEIERTARALKLLGVQLFNDLGLEVQLDEYCALDVISCHENICQRDLAKYILKDRANTGRILNSLEEKGFIKRINDTRNNRLIKRINLTPDGENVLHCTSEKLKNHVTRTVQPFQAKEVKQLNQSIKKFREHLESLLELKI